MGRRRLLAPLLTGLALALALTGCGAGSPSGSTGSSSASSASSASYAGSAAAEPSAPISTLTPLPVPTPPLTGRLTADLRQASIDLAMGVMQVWIDNGTRSPVTPLRLVYRDPRSPRPLLGQRLRPVPSRAERGFPLALPQHPACGAPRRQRVDLVYRTRGEVHRTTMGIDDETDVLGRWLHIRCAEIAVAQVARLRWAARVPYDGRVGHEGRLLLRVTPVGGPDDVLRLTSVVGTPMVASATGNGSGWHPGVTIHGDDPPSTVALPMRPARCDDHVFMEGGGSTAFRVHLALDGRPQELLLRMPPLGARRAIAFVRDSCGL